MGLVQIMLMSSQGWLVQPRGHDQSNLLLKCSHQPAAQPLLSGEVEQVATASNICPGKIQSRMTTHWRIPKLGKQKIWRWVCGCDAGPSWPVCAKTGWGDLCLCLKSMSGSCQGSSTIYAAAQLRIA